jgi:hypothetical protein
MSHPIIHSKSSVKKWGGKWEDYIHIHNWFDETKSWVGNTYHRMFRHHSEGIFECEKTFGEHFENSEGKIVYTRYVGEQHVKEDCYNYIPSAKEWVNSIESKEKPIWMIRTLKIDTD